MNSAQAKQIPIEHFLGKLNHRPVKIKGSDLWYKSPLRQVDNTPSFKVNRLLNSWYDFGYGQGGTIIDLVCALYNESVSDALRRLSSDYGAVSPMACYSPVKPAISATKKSSLVLESETSISEKALYCLLRDRCISPDIAKQYLRQIYFFIEGKQQRNYALAMKNDAGGYEFKNTLMKGCIGSKAITTINQKDGNDVAVFEGMMDFLAYLSHHKITEFQSTAIILNSVNLKDEALKALQAGKFNKIYFFLDNDLAGREAFSYLSSHLDCQYVDKSAIYADFKDYNDYWISLCSKNT